MVAPCAAAVPPDQIPDDPFHDSRLKFVGLALLLGGLATCALIGLIYVGSLYGTPSWSASSFPAPIAY
jgi:hypothetical protein